MKLNANFALRQVADLWVVMPMGAATADFNGMIKLNASGALLWQALEQGADREDLADALMKEYDVDRDRALADVDQFVASLASVGCIEI